MSHRVEKIKDHWCLLGGLIPNDRVSAGQRWIGSSGATVEIEGDERQIEKFIDSLPSNLPEIARISSLSKKEIQIKNEDGFKIITSQKGKRKDALTSFDSKICDDCKKEMEDKKNRRFHYPFTNCTNCGRFIY